MKKLISCIKGYTLPTILCPLLVVGEVVLEVLLPKLMAKMVDIAVPNEDLALVVKLGLIMVLCSIISLLCGALAGWACSVAGAGFSKNIRKNNFLQFNISHLLILINFQLVH